ncbi:hypothetical protein BDP27DRAFT_416455 [Rhodocollybia butyracea]|uniref:Uncharacterized protein n=1 Tax=Rhodocollybia butyracea TaxID=206335 RepID=A0A9P5UAX4_9AGAR|nr:hypothetical protein BDP27DRAFT_416455 [Rhodocollybia butyracea]
MHRTVHNNHSVNSNFGNSIIEDNSGQSHVTNNYGGNHNDNRAYTTADERHYYAHSTTSRGRAGYYRGAAHHGPYAASASWSRSSGYPGGQGENQSRLSSDAFSEEPGMGGRFPDPRYHSRHSTNHQGYPGPGHHGDPRHHPGGYVTDQRWLPDAAIAGHEAQLYSEPESHGEHEGGDYWQQPLDYYEQPYPTSHASMPAPSSNNPFRPRTSTNPFAQ